MLHYLQFKSLTVAPKTFHY